MASQQALRKVTTKPRIFIFSDISNEPDDAESLVRYLLYSNEFDTRGLVACTSTWLRRVTHPEDMETIIRACGKVVDNLNAHVHPDNTYPPAEVFLGLVKTGPPVYGLEALEDKVPLSDGSRALIQELESEEPLWVLCWGGTNAVARALQHIDRTRAEEDARRLRSKDAHLCYLRPGRHGAGIGATAYVCLDEVPTGRLRAKTVALGYAVSNTISVGWYFALPHMFNPDQGNLGGKIGFIFGGLSFIVIVLLYFFLPETRFRSYEELDEMFAAKIPARKFSSYVTRAERRGEEAKKALDG